MVNGTIIGMWHDGFSMTQISDKLNISICSVRSVIVDAGYQDMISHSEGAKRHYDMQADGKWRDIHNDLCKGLDLSAIQKKYGMTKERLMSLFDRKNFDYDAFIRAKQDAADDALKARLIDLRNSGKTVKEIADILDKSETTIGRYLLKFGLSKKSDRTDIDTAEIIAYWNKNWSMNMIAKKLSCSVDTVSKRLKSVGIVSDNHTGIEKHFDNIHDNDWDDIRIDLDACVPVSMIATKYNIRYEAVYRMIERHNYKFAGLSDIDMDMITDRTSNCSDEDELFYLNAIREYYSKTQNAPVIYTLSRFVDRDMHQVRNDVIKYKLSCFIGNESLSVKVLRIVNDLSKLGIQCELNNRKIIKSHDNRNLEIDIWLPDYNIGIEVNPTFTHSVDIEPFGKKNRDYHQNKSICAEEAGVGLIHLYDTDFMDESSYQRFLLQMKYLVSSKTKLGARQCHVRKISRQESNAFLDSYHFQGGEHASSVCYGLFCTDKLVGVLTVGRSRYAKADYEIIRYCMHPGYIITGCFEKLFTAFLRTLDADADILSYMDLNKRMRAHSVYERHGFEYLGITQPDYTWYNRSGTKMMSRYSAMKKNLVSQGFDSSKSEIQIMMEQGFVRVFGAGSKKFMYHYRITNAG